jgi:serine/threonine protein kinase
MISSTKLEEILQSPALHGLELINRAGMGGFASVYQLRNRSSGISFALKIQQLNNPRERERWAREISALVKLRHPYILRIETHGQSADFAWMLLEWLEGKSLDKALEGPPDRRPSLEWRLARLREVAIALETSHQAGILHRDVKPANIMLRRGLDGHEHAVLVDFGLARFELDERGKSLTQTSESLGTPGFAGPEQIETKGEWGAVTAKTDVWGLGATLYFTLASRPPFVGSSSFEVARSVLFKAPPNIAELAPDTPPWLTALISRCLQKEQDQRPDMKTLIEALKEPAPSPRLAEAQPPPTKNKKLKNYHPALTPITLLSIAIVIIGFLLWPPKAELIGDIEAPAWSWRERETVEGRVNRPGIALSLGDQKTQSDELGRFRFELPLQDGENSWTLRAGDRELRRILIRSDRKSPLIQIGSWTSEQTPPDWLPCDPEGYLNGQIFDDSPCQLTIASEAQATDREGRWRWLVPNEPRLRAIEIRVSDSAKNSTDLTLRVASLRAQERYSSEMALSQGVARFRERTQDRPSIHCLASLDRWDSASPEERKEAVHSVQIRLGQDFESLGLERFTCVDQSHEIGRFLHKPSGLELNLIPGGIARSSFDSDLLAGMERQVLEAIGDCEQRIRLLFAMHSIEPKRAESSFLRSLLREFDFSDRFEEALVDSGLRMTLALAIHKRQNIPRIKEVVNSRLEKLPPLKNQSVFEYVEPFLIARREVTIRDWEKLLTPPPIQFSQDERLKVQYDFKVRPNQDLPIPSPLSQARIYAKTAKLRLPSLSEWKLASRGGAKGRYFWGDNEADGAERVSGVFLQGAHLSWPRIPAINEKLWNAFGLVDVLGNLTEWVEPPWELWCDLFPEGREAMHQYSPDWEKWGATCGGGVNENFRYFSHDFIFVMTQPENYNANVGASGLRPALSIP